MKEVIAVLANIGTFLSAILILVTVLEMRAQRKAQVKPELILFSDALLIKKGMIRVLREAPTFEENEIVLNLLNIGLSPAKEVAIAFSYDLDKAIKTVECKEITVRRNGSTLYVTSPIGFEKMNVDVDTEQILEFVDVKREKDKSETVPIPRTFSLFVRLLSMVGAYKEVDSRETESIELRIEVKYKDLLDNEYRLHRRAKYYFAGLQYTEEPRFSPVWKCAVRR
ncbi:MAG: hypothetical protein HC888_04555 [Candidatus Competibacteraceae bacterium]|nr:hypothetical protein [Candidatus Competibacteraceae bacterium]